MLAIMAGAVLAAQGGAAEITFHVATNGNDTWSGKLVAPNAAGTDGPFATLVRARDAIRELKAKGPLPGPVTVHIGDGPHFVSETVRLGPEDSGTAECPVTYRSEGAQLVGGRLLTGFRRERGDVLALELPEAQNGAWVFRSLFDNGARQIRARYPNFDRADPYRGGFLYVGKGLGGFGMAVGNIHNVGDWMDYKVTVPADGEYAFWMYYGCDMGSYGVEDMGEHSVLSVDGGEALPLRNLPNTGGWGTFAWSLAANVSLTAGDHTLRWENVKGGGLNLEGYALSDDPNWEPEGTTLSQPAAGKHVLVIQAEDFAAYNGKQLSVGGSGGSKTAFQYDAGQLKASWLQEPDPEVHIFQSENCRAFKEIVRLERLDEQTLTAYVTGPECTSGLQTGDRYFVENLLEELDAPGEWYLDAEAGRLHYRPPDEYKDSPWVVAPTVSRLIEAIGTAEQPVSHVRFVGLQVSCTDYQPGGGSIGYGMGEEGVLHLENAADCAVEGCTFSSIGSYAVCLKGGSRNRIVGNDIADGGEGGVLLLDSGGNEVSDNHIRDCGWVYKHIGGVVLEGPGCKDNLVAHNLIHDVSRYGITLKSPGTNNTIEYNDLYNLNTETYDTGGIEVTQQDREFRSGSTIRYNRVRDVIGYSSQGQWPVYLSWGIYLDSFAGGYDVHHNLVARNHHGGIMLQGGKDNQVWNNVFVDGASCQGYLANFAGNSTGLVLERNLFVWTDEAARLFGTGSLNDAVIRIDRNLYWRTGCDGPATLLPAGGFAEWQARGFDAHSVVADPGFVDAAHDDYSLRADSPALQVGFEPIDAKAIGLVRQR
jgi:parallel beta-helix repeat protein